MVFAGCGGAGEPSAEDQARSAFERLQRAYAQRDWGAYCAELSQRRLDQVAMAQGRDCAAAIAQAQPPPSMGTSKVVAVRIEGDTAHVTLRRATGGVAVTANATAVREHGAWKIDDVGRTTAPGGQLLYRVPSASMAPTYRLGAQILVAPYHRRPAVGDVVVFYPPAGAVSVRCGRPQRPRAACDRPTPGRANVKYVKRIVAGPGDRVSVRRGRVVRNGTAVAEPYARPCSRADCNLSTPVTVPPGHWFVLGDNRGASDDSRFWGPVPTKWLIGRVAGQ